MDMQMMGCSWYQEYVRRPWWTWHNLQLTVQLHGERRMICHSSTRKTAVVLFNRKKSSKLSKKLRMNGEELEYVKEVKYLGIKLNHKLNWQEHILDRIKYCKGLMVQLRTAIGARWGPSPRLMLWAFNSLVVPALSYGAVVWGSQGFNRKIESELRRLNRLAVIGTNEEGNTDGRSGSDPQFETTHPRYEGAWVGKLHKVVQKT